MEEEIVQLKAELEIQRTRCARLEDELDDLAVDNDRLRKLLGERVFRAPVREIVVGVSDRYVSVLRVLRDILLLR